MPLVDVFEILFVAALPIAELRLAIPWAIESLNTPWYYAFLVAVVGNMLPVPFILLFIEAAVRLLSKVAVFERFFNWLFERTRRRGGESTGSCCMCEEPKQAFVSIFIGVIIAGIIVTSLWMVLSFAFGSLNFAGLW